MDSLLRSLDRSSPHLHSSYYTSRYFYIIASSLPLWYKSTHTCVFAFQVHPYLNRGLNDFQRLALVTQFITCVSGMIYLMVGCLDELHEVSPDRQAQGASTVLTIVVFGLNWVTAVLYPAYRYILQFVLFFSGRF